MTAKIHLPLAPPASGFVPDLASYHVILISSSGGKDSQAMLDYVTRLADAAGVRHRIVVVHADLGRVEWQGTRELAEEQARHYGHRFEVVSRIGGTAAKSGKKYKVGETFGDLLDYAERHGKWPDSGNRWCTSDFKRGPILRLVTALDREWRARGNRGTFRLLDCQGLRASESPRRAKLPQFKRRDEASTKTGTRLVDTWLPIQDWGTTRVWHTIRASGVPHHRAYDLGMPRLSCVFCIFAPRAALKLAGRHNPDLLADYVAAEQRMGHRFRMDVSLEEIQAAIESEPKSPPDAADLNDEWNM